MWLTFPLASTCSAANTTPPQRGHPCPGFAFIEVVSTTGARDVLTSLNVIPKQKQKSVHDLCITMPSTYNDFSKLKDFVLNFIWNTCGKRSSYV